MNPRLEYYGDLDEIEAELGKERTLKVGDKVKVSGRNATMVYRCAALEGRWHVGFEDIPGSCCVSESECIPVEPERVCQCDLCAVSLNQPDRRKRPDHCGMDHFGECAFFRPRSSPGLLQRMGMCVWEGDEEDWLVVEWNPKSGDPPRLMTDLKPVTRTYARTWSGKDCRMFRWSQGGQG